MVQTKDGHVVTEADSVKAKQKLAVRLTSGELGVTVDSVSQRQPGEH